MVCIQKICLKILKDHLAVQASSIDSPEKQRLTIEKFLQANGPTPMDVDALAKTKGGMFLVRCSRLCSEGLSKEGSREA